MHERAAVLLLWLASACGQTSPGPARDESTTDPGTTSGATIDTVSTGTPSDDTAASTEDTGPIEPSCGDGVVSPPEECDLGEQNGTGMYCKAECRANVCGDGYLGPGEACDDGNRSNADACTSDCGAPTCGDGIVQGREQCDDGFGNAPEAACLPGCVPASCGDGHVHQGVEQCDGEDLNGLTCDVLGLDGGTLACTGDCLSVDTSACWVCGNGVLDPVEPCDGTELGGETCESLLGPDFAGPLQCYSDCVYDLSACCEALGVRCSSHAECCSGWCTPEGVCQPAPR